MQREWIGREQPSTEQLPSRLCRATGDGFFPALLEYFSRRPTPAVFFPPTSGCTPPVRGESWMRTYREPLTPAGVRALG
jgi:hypothetical protein